MSMQIRSITDIGNFRNYNDDSCFYDEKKELMVIADGMGGYAGGRIASRIAVDVFRKYYMGITEETYQEELRNLFSISNNAIVDEAKRHNDHNKMGTTLTALCIYEDQYYIAHVGDSRAYLYRDGKLHRLTEDHNLVTELLKTKQITKKEAVNHPGKSMLTRVIGRAPLAEIDFYSGKTEEDDLFLLCTDGVSGSLDDKKIASSIKGNLSIEQMLNKLVNKVLDRGGKDNITAILGKKL